MAVAFGLGTSSQLTTVDARMAVRIGCRTCTPAFAAMTPVMVGKRPAPSCATASTKTMAVECDSGGKSLELMEMPCGQSVAAVGEYQNGDGHTVAKSGPVKKPMKATAMEAAMMFGTLFDISVRAWKICH